jgi:Calcineurin-like phosphoesterase
MRRSRVLSSRTAGLVLCIAVAMLAATAWAQSPVPADTKLPLLDRPWSSDSEKFSFAILGDKTSGGEGKWPIFDRAVDAINQLAPDFVITVGDQIPGHMQDRAAWEAEWAEYLEHAKRLEYPLFLVVGNHDIANIECYRFWQEDFGRTYYSFDYKGCHFLVLNTEEERFDGRGPVWQAMLEFAERDLSADTGSRHTFVFFHKPMWDDPRYDDDWARIERALKGRKYTAVAGHEHYLATERSDDDLRVIQSATGGGIHLSNVKAIGCFHSFGYITVDGDETRYAVVEPEGGVWPVDVAPASFRKAITFDMVKVDAAQTEGLDSDTVTVRTTVAFSNPLQEPVAIRLAIGPLLRCGWRAVGPPDSAWKVDGETVSIEVPLEPGQSYDASLVFGVPADRLSYPPGIGHEVRYQGEWLAKETYNMVEVGVVPIYPVAALRAVPEWQLVGPFPLGDIDTSHLPDAPAKANPNFFKRFGPEDGYDPDRVYDGGLRWYEARGQGWGLLNFNGLMGTLDHALGYALCGVYSPEAQLTHAAVYADNFSQVVLNGELVKQGQDFGAPGGFVYVPLHLRAGWNTVTAKLINNHGDWFLRFLIADPKGNLRFASHPD